MEDRSVELEAVVAAACSEIGLDLVDFDVHDTSVAVTVERSDGLDLDVLATASRLVSDVLDAHEELVPAGRYELEVSSPGLERRLRRLSHFERALGAAISLRTLPGTPGPRRIDGVLSEVDGETVVISADGGARHEVAFAAIERAHTVFDWKAALTQDNAARRRPASSPRASSAPVLEKEGRS